MMELTEYFERSTGTGILATSDDSGAVDLAIYSRPHVMDDGTLAFVMRERLTHHNLKSNPHAAYMFIEDAPGYRGKRLFLTKVKESEDDPLIDKLKRRSLTPEEDQAKGPKFLVIFRVDRELPLVGGGQLPE